MSESTLLTNKIIIGILENALVARGVVADLNEFMPTGIYTLQPTTIDGPLSGNMQGSFLIHLKWDTNCYYQLILSYSDQRIYFRVAKGKIWYSWKKIAFETIEAA